MGKGRDELETQRTVGTISIGSVQPWEVHSTLVYDVVVDETDTDDAEEEDLVRGDEGDEDRGRAEQVPRVDAVCQWSFFFTIGLTYTMVMIMQTANARFIERYLGAKDEMSFPAGRTFSKVQLLSVAAKISEYGMWASREEGGIREAEGDEEGPSSVQGVVVVRENFVKVGQRIPDDFAVVTLR
jgi:hypothetical protein